MLATKPEPIKDWPLTSLKEKLIKIGAKKCERWPLRHLPDGRGGHSSANVPGDSAADR